MGQHLTIATLNINGLPTFWRVAGSPEKLVAYSKRHKALGVWLEKSDIDIINFQEVFNYRDLALLKKHLPSYPFVAFKPYLFGPRGAVAIFSKLPLKVVGYVSYGAATKSVDLSRLPRFSQLKSTLKGLLIAQVEHLPLTVINNHILANIDLDSGPDSRFYPIQQAQLGQVAQAVARQSNNVVVAGDLNVEAGSQLINNFLRKARLHDPFTDDTASTFHAAFLPIGYSFKNRIDYLLTSRQDLVVPGSAQRILESRQMLADGRQVYLTDHIGLRVKLRF